MIPIAMPVLEKAEAEAAHQAVLSGWVSQGPQVAAFEREFAALVGAPHACAVSNCTTALHLALLAVGVGPGDEVITASHSFIATANSIRYCGATPVFVDIDPSDLQYRSAAGGRGRNRPHARHSCRSPNGDALRPACPDGRGKPSRHCPDRRRRLRCGKPNPDKWTMGADWQAPRTDCLLFLPSAQGHHDRRGRHADDVQSGVRPQIQAVPPARHERP